MEPVVGIFRSRSAAEMAARDLRAGGIAPAHIQLLLPESAGSNLPGVPTEDAEQPGVGKAVGGVVGGAVGASAGLGLGTAAASLLVPGVGAVTAIGLAAAALFGAGGAVGGAAAAGALEDKTQRGLPRDELYLYEDALAQGRSIVLVLAESAKEAASARRTLEDAGAESLDAAREAWWIGLRDAEKEHYESSGADFASAEPTYRKGFAAALHPDLRGKSYSEAHEFLSARLPGLAGDEAFRRGYERGQAWVSQPVEKS